MNNKKKFYLFALLVIFSALVAVFSGYFSPKIPLLEPIFSISPSLTALIYVLVFITLTTFSFSVTAVTASGILFFTGPEVVFYSLIGIMGSSIIDFYIAKKLGRTYVRSRIARRRGKLARLDKVVEKNTFKTILILSTIFFVPPTIPNFLGGIINIKFRDYVLATFLGNMPNTILTVYLILGLINSNPLQIYLSVLGLIVVSTIALYFYKGEVGSLLRMSFPWIYRKRR